MPSSRCRDENSVPSGARATVATMSADTRIGVQVGYADHRGNCGRI
jgi:hypothetical protein